MEKVIVTENPAELRQLARAVLKGNWGKLFAGMVIYSILAVLVPNLISIMVESFSYSVYIEEIDMNYNFPAFLHLYQLVMGGILEFGIYAFILHYLRTREVRYDRLFAGFERFAVVFLVSFLISIFTGLWSLLFVIPGIIAFFRYYMSLYILHDNPNVGVLGAIRTSKWMMDGNKANLFLTLLSFIGWRILAYLPVAVFSSLFRMGYLSSLPAAWLVIMEFVLYLPTYFVLVYSETAVGIFYELASGRLRKTPSVSTGFMPQDGGAY